MAASVQTSLVMRASPAGASASFGGRRLSIARYRLSAEEQAGIRYVVAEWDGDAGCRSAHGPMVEKLAAMQVRREKMKHRKHRHLAKRTSDLVAAMGMSVADIEMAAAHQCVFVPKSNRSNVRPESELLHVQEQWSNVRHGKQTKMRAAWLAAYRALCRIPTGHQAVLVRLYGTMPPGLPPAGLWHRDMDLEYRRVAGLTDAYADACASQDDMVGATFRCVRGQPAIVSFCDRGAALSAFERSIGRGVAPEVRTSRLRAIAEECEALIVAASRAYQAAAEV